MKLRGRVREILGSEKRFAELMGWSERTTSLKMNGKRPWKQPEIVKAIKILKLSDADIQTYFFTVKVQSSELIAQKKEVV